MKRLTTALGFLLLAACTAAPPPQEGTAPRQPWVPTPPVYALIGQRQDLNLTSEQVTALDSIGVALQRENSPILDRIREIAPSGGFGRRVSASDRERMQPLVDSIRENNREAQQAVREVLTEPQRTQVCRLFSGERDEARRRAADEARRNPRMRGGIARDTLMTGRQGVWTWCGPQPAAGDTTAAQDTTPRDTVPRL